MSMDNQQNRTRSDRSNGYPAFLIGERIVALRDRIGIVENKSGGLKSNIMLAKILAVLVLIPSKSHSR